MGEHHEAYYRGHAAATRELQSQIPKPGTLEWALMQMKAGKAVQRKGWHKLNSITLDWMQDDNVLNALSHESILATDWRLAEEGDGSDD